MPEAGLYRVLLSSDGGEYGGFGTMQGSLSSLPEESHGQPQRLLLNLAPNSVLFLELASATAPAASGPTDMSQL